MEENQETETTPNAEAPAETAPAQNAKATPNAEAPAETSPAQNDKATPNTETVEYTTEFREAELPIADDLKAMFKTAGLNDESANSLTKGFYELQDRLTEQFAVKSKKDLAEWNAEQGDNLNRNQELAKRGASSFGLSEDQIAGVERTLGTKAFMDFCLRQGTALSEDTAKGMSGSQAQTSEEMSTEAYLNEIFSKMKGM